MPSEQPPQGGPGKVVSINRSNGDAFVQKAGSAERKNKNFESDVAVEIIEELYPLLLQNCTDDDDEIDTQAVFESLAGLVGLFIADYREGYGDEKAKAAFQDLVDMALNLYEERIAEQTEE
jgi:hypothetical protein